MTPPLPPQALTAVSTLSVSMNLPVLGVSYKWHFTLCALCDWLLPLSTTFSGFIHLIALNQYFIPLFGCFCDLENIALKCYLFSLLLFACCYLPWWLSVLACPLIFVPEAVSHSPHPISILVTTKMGKQWTLSKYLSRNAKFQSKREKKTTAVFLYSYSQ